MNEDMSDLRDLTSAWVRRLGVGKKGVRSVRQLVEGAADTEVDLRDALMRVGGDGMNRQRIGRWLRRHAGEVCGNLRLVHVNSGKWGVEMLLRGGVAWAAVSFDGRDE